jgi:hypothetical protein
VHGASQGQDQGFDNASSALNISIASELTIEGLSKQGFLLASDDLGRVYELTPDGNSLDMMKGLIKRKANSA